MNINGNRIDRLSNGIYRNIDLIFYHLEEEKQKKKKLSTIGIGINGCLNLPNHSLSTQFLPFAH